MVYLKKIFSVFQIFADKCKEGSEKQIIKNGLMVLDMNYKACYALLYYKGCFVHIAPISIDPYNPIEIIGEYSYKGQILGSIFTTCKKGWLLCCCQSESCPSPSPNAYDIRLSAHTWDMTSVYLRIHETWHRSICAYMRHDIRLSAHTWDMTWVYLPKQQFFPILFWHYKCRRIDLLGGDSDWKPMAGRGIWPRKYFLHPHSLWEDGGL